MSDNLKQRMFKALTWTTIDRFGQQAVQLVIGLVLARLLLPEDYGLMGMIVIFIALSSVMVDGGFGQALIRKENATQTDFSTIFFLNLAISSFLYLILFFSAPLISHFYKQPQLVNISRVLFLSIIFYAIYFVQYVLLIKEVAFKSLAKINIASTIVSGGIGIFLAISGARVWALVAQQISYHIIRLISFFIIRKWKPVFVFSFTVIKELWTFSIHLLGTSVLNVIFNNIYFVLIGKFYPLKQTGYYTQANKLSDIVNYSFQQILQGGTFPLLVQIQDQEERYRRVYRKMMRTISIFLFPFLFTLIIVSRPIISILLTEKWTACILLFQLLCLANLFTPFYGLNISVLNARGESRKSLQLELIKKGLILLSVFACFLYGIVTMLIGFVIANYIAYGVSMLFIRKNLTYQLKQQLLDIFPSFIVSVLVSTIVFLLKGVVPSHAFLRLLLIQSTIAIAMYILIVYVFDYTLVQKVNSFVRNRLLKNTDHEDHNEKPSL
jgi:O-antigen/teichoic acid export membrane protein